MVLVKKHKIKLVNIYGGPSAGKSTVAALLFGEMKIRGYNCEYLPEVAKQFVYEKNTTTLGNQVYLLGESLKNILTLDGQVDVAILDSPLLLNHIYGVDYPPSFHTLVNDMSERFDQFNIYLHRPMSYQVTGRVHNEIEAMVLDTRIDSMLTENGVSPYKIKASFDCHKEIADMVSGWLYSCQ